MFLVIETSVLLPATVNAELKEQVWHFTTLTEAQEYLAARRTDPTVEYTLAVTLDTKGSIDPALVFPKD